MFGEVGARVVDPVGVFAARLGADKVAFLVSGGSLIDRHAWMRGRVRGCACPGVMPVPCGVYKFKFKFSSAAQRPLYK